jgi:hypothetical protein
VFSFRPSVDLIGANPVREGFIRGWIAAGLGVNPSRWENVGMATKRTKADKAQRQTDQLEKKSERRPEQETGKRKVRKDFSRAA